MKKLICWIFGHNFKYNFKSIPNKRICAVCRKKQEFRGFKESLKHIRLDWEEVNEFAGEKRKDDDLIRKWHGRDKV